MPRSSKKWEFLKKTNEMVRFGPLDLLGHYCFNSHFNDDINRQTIEVFLK